MGNQKIEVFSGDIFAVPLFLPSYQEWTKFDDWLDYRRYQFPSEDIYAFGRLIEIQTGHMDLVEIFSYVGRIPESPDRVIASGRMFAPEHIGHSVFTKGRWRVIFSDPRYDMRRDSDYDNIIFLSPVGHMWKGKETILITEEQRDALYQAGTPYFTANSAICLEERIRSALAARGMDLQYEQTVEQRRAGFPKPRDADKKLKETIAPFRWQAESGRYTLSLEAGLLNDDCFAKHGMLGNGYDWQKAAAVFMDRQGIDFRGKVSFDCEADTFVMVSSVKKPLKEFAVAFHELAMNSNAFDEFLGEWRECN